jgi:hypothetical protein
MSDSAATPLKPTEATTAPKPTDATTAPKPTETAPEKPVLAFPHPWRIAVVVGVIMVLLALLGVGLTTARSTAAQVYWISMVPLYGALCMVTAYLSAQKGHFDFTQVYRQAAHWLGIGLAVAVDFFLLRSGEESGMGAGLVALLLLAVGCFTAGVHLQWLFILVGLLLGATLIIVVSAEQYSWLIFVIGVVTVVLMFLLPRLFGLRRG